MFAVSASTVVITTSVPHGKWSGYAVALIHRCRRPQTSGTCRQIFPSILVDPTAGKRSLEPSSDGMVSPAEALSAYRRVVSTRSVSGLLARRRCQLLLRASARSAARMPRRIPPWDGLSAATAAQPVTVTTGPPEALHPARLARDLTQNSRDTMATKSIQRICRPDQGMVATANLIDHSRNVFSIVHSLSDLGSAHKHNTHRKTSTAWY